MFVFFGLSLKNDNFYPNIFSFKKTFFIFAPLLIEITILYITQHMECDALKQAILRKVFE